MNYLYYNFISNFRQHASLVGVPFKIEILSLNERFDEPKLTSTLYLKRKRTSSTDHRVWKRLTLVLHKCYQPTG